MPQMPHDLWWSASPKRHNLQMTAWRSGRYGAGRRGQWYKLSTLTHKIARTAPFFPLPPSTPDYPWGGGGCRSASHKTHALDTGRTPWGRLYGTLPSNAVPGGAIRVKYSWRPS